MGIFYFAAADLEQQVTSLGTKTVLIASVILVVFTIIAALVKNRYKKLKLPLFIILASAMVIPTIILFGSTIYLNTKAESKGPVHWHADIEFWACGGEVELRNPTGTLSNKIGTATYHEHNDKRIHLEGVVVRKSEDASLEKFMRVTGGYITDSSIGIPINENEDQWLVSGDQLDGDTQHTDVLDTLRPFVCGQNKSKVLELKNNEGCNSRPAEVQVFVYSFDKTNKTYSQRKLHKPGEYVLRNESIVPPGDCVIVEFDARKSRTDKLCRQYGVRDQKRCTEFGVETHNEELCNIREEKLYRTFE